MNREERLKAAEAAYPMLKGLSNSNKITVANQRSAFVKGAEAEAESIRMTRADINQLFDIHSDCNTTFLHGTYQSKAMSKNRFVELLYSIIGNPTP